MLALSFSGDLLTSLTHAITNPLAEDLNTLSLQGAESLYREYLDVKRWHRDGPEVKSMITLLISEGLLAKVLEKTLLYNQVEGSQINTSTADLLLTLSLKAHTTDARVRMELSRTVHILSEGWTELIQDLLTGWLEEALFRFPWIWPTVRKARTIPLLMARVIFTCHRLQNKPSNLLFGLRAIEILCHLCQDHSYCSDVLNFGTHSLLNTANNAQLMQMARPAKEDHIGSLAQDIQFSVIECVKLMTTPRPQDDPPHGTLRFLNPGWNVETTWNWILQTMLAFKSLPTQYISGRIRINYGTGLHTLHHLMTMEAHLTTQQKENAWFLLRRAEIPDLYAHLICSHFHDIDRNAAVGMAAVLEGHTQAVSRISRDQTAKDEIIYLSPGHDVSTRLQTGQGGNRRHAKMDTPANRSRPMGLS